jgi:AraC family ethanolamine operon transcriptional activator
MDTVGTDCLRASVEIFDIGNPNAANGCVELLDQDLVQLQGQTLKGRQVIVRLGRCVLMYYSTNLRVRTRPRLMKDYVGYIAFGPSAAGLVNGLQVRSDLVIAVPKQAVISMVAHPQYESVAFLLEPDLLEELVGDSAAGSRARLAPSEVSILQSAAGFAGALFAWGKLVIDAAVHDAEPFNTSETHRQTVEADLVEQLRTTLNSARKWEPARSERLSQAKSQIVQNAEKFALSQTGERLYVTDLCKAAGVSERTLEYAFRAVMGLSPTSYLTKIRLHKVHRALLIGTPATTTVTTEALNWGFWHFGEFSKAYKTCFDELPSETLRRAPARLAA